MDNSKFPTFRLSLHLSKEDALDQEEHNLHSQVSGPASSLDTNLTTSEASHTVLLDLMWQFDPTFRLETSSVTPFINVPPPPSVPGLIWGLQSLWQLCPTDWSLLLDLDCIPVWTLKGAFTTFFSTYGPSRCLIAQILGLFLLYNKIMFSYLLTALSRLM